MIIGFCDANEQNWVAKVKLITTFNVTVSDKCCIVIGFCFGWAFVGELLNKLVKAVNDMTAESIRTSLQMTTFRGNGQGREVNQILSAWLPEF